MRDYRSIADTPFALVDLARSSFEIALDLIYIENQYKLYKERTSLGKPQELDVRPDEIWDANTYTTIRIQDNFDDRFIGKNGLNYRRMGFNEVGLKVIPVLPRDIALHALLPLINAMYKLGLAPEDVMDMVLSKGYSGNVVLRAEAESLAYVGIGTIKQSETLLEQLVLDCFKEWIATDQNPVTSYKGTSLQRLGDELNTANRLMLVPGVDYTFNSVRAINGANGINTEVVFKPLIFAGLFKEQKLQYTRLNIDVLNNLPKGYLKPVVIEKLPSTYQELVPAINKAFGLDLVADEIVDGVVPYDVTELVLNVNENNSLAWIGKIAFEAIVSGKLHIKTAVVDTDIGTIVPPFDVDASVAFDAHDSIVRLIKEKNPQTAQKLKSTDVVVSNVEVVASGPYNSMARVSATPSSDYYGGVEVFYNRIPLSVLGEEIALRSAMPITLQLVVDCINKTKNAHLTVDDVEITVPTNLKVGDVGTVTVRAKANSLGWIGSVDVAYLYGLPEEIDILHIHVNFTLPGPGYIT